MGCLLTAGVAKTCDNLDNGGLKNPAIWLINLDDISAITYSSNVITAITLKGGGKQAYKFDGFGLSTKPAYRQLTGRGEGPTFEHEAGVNIFDLTVAGKDIVAELTQSPVLAIVETNVDLQAFEVYGTSIGMRSITAEHIKTDAANGGAIQVVLKTPEDGPAERKPPNDFFDTDRATTLALVEALETPTA